MLKDKCVCMCVILCPSYILQSNRTWSSSFMYHCCSGQKVSQLSRRYASQRRVCDDGEGDDVRTEVLRRS